MHSFTQHIFVEYLPCTRNVTSPRNKVMNSELGSYRTYNRAQKMGFKQIMPLCSEYFIRENTGREYTAGDPSLVEASPGKWNVHPSSGLSPSFWWWLPCIPSSRSVPFAILDAFHRVHAPVMKIRGILAFYITTDKLLHREQSLLSFRRGMILIKNSPEFEPTFPD